MAGVASLTLVVAGVALTSEMPSVTDGTPTADGAQAGPVRSINSGVKIPGDPAAAVGAGLPPSLQTKAIQGRCRRANRHLRGAAAARGRTSDISAVGGGASSAGSADIHWYAAFPDHALHVIYLEARWDRQAGRRIRAADEWRATVTLGRRDDAPLADLAVQHWYTDLPDACLEVTSSGGPGGTRGFAVVVREVARLQPNRSYTAEVHFASEYDLAGTPWTYHEELLTTRRGRSRSAGTSHRAGEIGTCAWCFITWDEAVPGPRTNSAAVSTTSGAKR